MNKVVYLVTGVTGDLGGELLSEMATNEQAEIYCLIRFKNQQDSQQRLDKLLEERGLTCNRNIFAVAGDICLPKLGLDDDTYFQLADKVTIIIHAAADVRFNQTIETMRQTNVNGTNNMLDFAVECQNRNMDFKHFIYVSTAYVSGCRPGLIRPEDLSNKYGFSNSYEQSKFESESLVRLYSKNGLPMMIFRPSIILGVYEDGRIRPSSALYPALMLYHKLLPSTVLPIRNKVKYDIVPIDYVVKAIVYIGSDRQNVNQCFHLAAGPRKAIYDTQFTRITVQELGIKDVNFIPAVLWQYLFLPYSKHFKPVLYKRIMKIIKMNSISGYDSYFNAKAHFSIKNTEDALRGSGIKMPDTVRFLRSCVRFAKQTYFN